MQAITQAPQVFTDSWWNTLLNNTNYLTTPTVIKDSVPQALFNEQDLAGIFRQVPTKLGFGEPGLRVYVGSGQQVTEMVEIYRNPIQPEETLRQFTQRIFGESSFGLIVNRATKYHIDLAKRLAPLYQGIKEKLGVEWIDLNATLFVGNYGYTPFGVHYDGEAKSVIHFHQGPGKKLMTLWDDETFEGKTGSRIHYPYPEKILPYGTTYEIEANDTFFLPEGPFHIGNTEEFSMALTVVIKGISVKDWLTNALAEMNTDSFNPEVLAGYETDVDEVFAQGVIESTVSDLPFNNLVKTAMEDYQLSLKSNCGFKPPRWSDEKTYENLATQRIQLVQPFQMYHKALKDNQVRLYFRRNKQNFAEAKTIVPMIEQLNNGDVLEVGKVLEQHTYNKDYLTEFFTLLLNHQAIELV
ncbi:MAG TPA: hypothetical protein DCS93_04915 [Microscillaceae bacterium]|nr:hypothetical protein [Microscillaceae bacterium]